MLIVPVFAQLHRSGHNLVYETLFESVRLLDAGLWQRMGKINGYFKNSTFCSPAVAKFINFQKRGPSFVPKPSLRCR